MYTKTVISTDKTRARIYTLDGRYIDLTDSSGKVMDLVFHILKPLSPNQGTYTTYTNSLEDTSSIEVDYEKI